MSLVPFSQQMSQMSQEQRAEASQQLLNLHRGTSSQEFHKIIANMTDILRQCAAGKPIEKTLQISYHIGGNDPIRLIFDNDPTIEITYENFVRAQVIHLTDTNGGDQHVIFNHTVTCQANFEGGGQQLLIDYGTGSYLFTDRYSITHWAVPAPQLFQAVTIYISWA